MKVCVLQEDAVHDAGRKRAEGLEAGLIVPLTTGRRCQAGRQNLRRARVAHGEHALPPGIAICAMGRRAHEPEVVPPSHRDRHVLRSQVIRPVGLPGAHYDERGHVEEAIPDRVIRAKRDQILRGPAALHPLLAHR